MERTVRHLIKSRWFSFENLVSRTTLGSSISLSTAMFVDIGVDGGSEALWHFNYGSTNNSPKGRWEMLGGYGLLVFTAAPRWVHF